jgi:hypothetical protein
MNSFIAYVLLSIISTNIQTHNPQSQQCRTLNDKLTNIWQLTPNSKLQAQAPKPFKLKPLMKLAMNKLMSSNLQIDQLDTKATYTALVNALGEKRCNALFQGIENEYLKHIQQETLFGNIPMNRDKFIDSLVYSINRDES